MPISNTLIPAPFNFEIAKGSTDATAYWVETSDKVKLRVAHWQGTEKGTVFLFQGRTENIEKYGQLAGSFVSAGYNVLAVDWRGQGLSPRMTPDVMAGHVKHYNDYQLDVEATRETATKLSLPKPWYIVGHSLGAAIGLRALHNGFPANACAFSAPLWDVNLKLFERAAAWPLSWAASVFGKQHAFAPGTRGESYVLNNPFEGNRLTNDPAMYQYYVDISEGLVNQQLGGPTLGWLHQTLRETRRLRGLHCPDIPCVTFCGSEDTIVAIPSAQNLMKKWENGSFQLIPKAKHDVFHETLSLRQAAIDATTRLFEQNT